MSYRNSNAPKNYVKKPKNEKPRNARLTFSVLCTGVNKNGFEYDPQECFDILADLEKNRVYDVINIPVQVARNLIDPDSGKNGQSTVAHVLEYDAQENELAIMVYANYVQKIDQVPCLMIEPRLMVRDGHVTSILSLDIVQYNPDNDQDDNTPQEYDNEPADGIEDKYNTGGNC